MKKSKPKSISFVVSFQFLYQAAKNKSVSLMALAVANGKIFRVIFFSICFYASFIVYHLGSLHVHKRLFETWKNYSSSCLNVVNIL